MRVAWARSTTAIRRGPGPLGGLAITSTAAVDRWVETRAFPRIKILGNSMRAALSTRVSATIAAKSANLRNGQRADFKTESNSVFERLRGALPPGDSGDAGDALSHMTLHRR